MSQDEIFTSLKNYFETKPAPRLALSAIRPGVEIGLRIGGQLDCTIFNSAGLPAVERRIAHNPDFVFYIEPETVLTLTALTTDDLSELGISIFKEIVAGHIRVQLKTGLWEIYRNGYFKMLGLGGHKFLEHIAAFGLLSMTTLAGRLEKLKSRAQDSRATKARD